MPDSSPTWLHGFLILLFLQLAGEVLAFLWPISVPGPLWGMALALLILMWRGTDNPTIEATCMSARTLIAHLSLLFVPAGVGIMKYLQLMEAVGLKVLVALVFSTILGMAATTGTYLWLLKKTPNGKETA